MPQSLPAPISLAPRVVVFDYGEVISREPSEADRASLLARAGVRERAEEFWTACQYSAIEVVLSLIHI